MASNSQAGVSAHGPPAGQPADACGGSRGSSDGGAHPQAYSKHKMRWSAEEDLRLRDLVELHKQDWATIEQHIPGRSRKSVRDRWKHLQSLGVGEQWSPEEEFQLACWHAWLGPCWAQITSSLAGGKRSKDQIINYWSSMYHSPGLDAMTTRPLAMYMRLIREGAPPNKDTLTKAQQMVHATVIATLGRRAAAAAGGDLNSALAIIAGLQQLATQASTGQVDIPGPAQPISEPQLLPVLQHQPAPPSQPAPCDQDMSDRVNFDDLFKDDLDDEQPMQPMHHMHHTQQHQQPVAHMLSQTPKASHGMNMTGFAPSLRVEGVNVKDLDDDLDLLDNLLKDVGMDDFGPPLPVLPSSSTHHQRASHGAQQVQVPATPPSTQHASQPHLYRPGHHPSPPNCPSPHAPTMGSGNHTSPYSYANHHPNPPRVVSCLSEVMDSLNAERGQSQLLPPPALSPLTPQTPGSAAGPPRAHPVTIALSRAVAGPLSAPSTHATTSAPGSAQGGNYSMAAMSPGGSSTAGADVMRMPARLAIARHMATLADLRRWGSSTSLEVSSAPGSSPLQSSITEPASVWTGAKRSFESQWSADATNFRAKRSSSGPYTLSSSGKLPSSPEPASMGALASGSKSMAGMPFWSQADLRQIAGHSQAGSDSHCTDLVSSPEMDIPALFP